MDKGKSRENNKKMHAWPVTENFLGPPVCVNIVPTPVWFRW